MDLTYRTCNFVQKGALNLFADWKVEGRENVPPMGPLLVVANHQSNFDPTLLAVAVPRRLRFLAKETIFRNVVSNWFLVNWGAFPLNREAPADPRAFRWALKLLAHDGTLAVFPEGTRSRGRMKRALSGVAALALKSQVPLLPVGITGTEQLNNLLRVFNPTGKIKVKIGSVFSIPSIEGKVSKEVLESITDMIMGRIAVLLPESYRGVYGSEAVGQSMSSKATQSP